MAVVVFLVQAACAIGTTPAATTQAPAPVENTGDLIATGIAQTLAAQPVIVVVPTNTQKPLEVLPTKTPEAPAATAAPSVQGSVNYGANCRTGPGANFPNVVVYQQGTLVNIIGKNNATDGAYWWLVSSSGQTDCWLIDAAVTITGDKASVVKVVSPPTPTPVPPPSWAGTWHYWMGGGFDGASGEEGDMTITQSGNYLSWNFYEWGYYFTASGTLSTDGMTFTGKLNRSNSSYTWDVAFHRNPSNLNQFRGSWSAPGSGTWDGNWCGSINGAAKPNPCK